MCCIGCKAVAEFIHDSGLDAFYAHRSAPLAEYGLKAEDSDWRQYDSEDVRQRFVHEADGRAEAVVDQRPHPFEQLVLPAPLELPTR